MSTELLPLEAQASYKQLAGTVAVAVASAEAHAKASHERFNIFSTLLRESDEVRLHTRFIHCLLDPRGSHDCGSLFLDLFFESLATLGVMDESGKEVEFKRLPRSAIWTVRKEASCPPHGQIDLLLESSCFFGIAIENKIHAGERAAQLSDYGDYLGGRYNDSFHLVYLTLDGKVGFTAGDYGYLRISYERHVLHWLEACLRETYNIVPVNQVIIQYRAVVRRLTHQPLENTFMKPVLDFIRENPEILRHNHLITPAVDQVRAEVLDQFAAGIMKSVMEFASDAKINPKLREGKFGVGDDRAIWITPGSTIFFRVLPFNIWIEFHAERILLGLKVPRGVKGLDPDTQVLLSEMNRLMNEDPGSADSRESTQNTAWPTGWDRPVDPLNDEVIAEWLRTGTEAVVRKVSQAVRSHIHQLEKAYTTASEEIARSGKADQLG